MSNLTGFEGVNGNLKWKFEMKFWTLQAISELLRKTGN